MISAIRKLFTSRPTHSSAEEAAKAISEYNLWAQENPTEAKEMERFLEASETEQNSMMFGDPNKYEVLRSADGRYELKVHSISGVPAQS